MFLGRHKAMLTAVDTKSIYAKAAPALKAEVVLPEPAPVEVIAVSSVTVTEAANAREIQHLREQNAIYRNRIKNLLNVLRGKNRTIARQERELAAAQDPNKLTVEQVLAASSVNQ